MATWAFGIEPVDIIYRCKCGQLLGSDEYDDKLSEMKRVGYRDVRCELCRKRFLSVNIFVCPECLGEVIGYGNFTNHYIMHFIDRPKNEIPVEVRNYVRRRRPDIALRFG